MKKGDLILYGALATGGLILLSRGKVTKYVGESIGHAAVNLPIGIATGAAKQIYEDYEQIPPYIRQGLAQGTRILFEPFYWEQWGYNKIRSLWG
jgi:xanthine/uracil permease